MLKIIGVGALGDNNIDVHLSNGSIILLCLTPYLREPRFAPLMEDDRILYPKTDGEYVFWKNGPRLSIEEIFWLAEADKQEEKSK
jgi:hypothetical protein